MPDLSPEELAHLDRLWNHPSLTLSEIKSRMQLKFGAQFTQEQLREAARRHDKPVVKQPVAIVLAPRRATVWKPALIRDTQCTRPVARGTFPVGPQGFSMLKRGNV